MTTLMRSAAVAAVGLFVAFGTVGCDDNHGGGGGTTTTSLAITTTTSGVTTTTSGVTTTTSGATTTTVAGPSHLECAVTWGLSNAVSIGALQFDTNYSAAGGQMEGTADQVICTKLVGDLVTFNDDDAAQNLSAAFVSLAGFSGPVDVMKCNFNTPNNDLTPPVAGDFVVTIKDATDPNLQPVTADVAVNNINCVEVGGGTTTTVSTSTTSTTTGGGATFRIDFAMADAVTVGALQFEVDYAGANGGFNGSADTVQCTKDNGDLVTFNDDEANTNLIQAFVSLAGFAGPNAALSHCTFTSNGGTPAASAFVVTVKDATDPNLAPISPLPTINVTVTAQ